MASGGVTAQFEFLSYKIDLIDLTISNNLQNLLYTNPIREQDVDLSIQMRSTEKFRLDDGSIRYVGGLAIKVAIIGEGTNKVLDAVFGISGAFAPVGEVSSKAEAGFTKTNLPAILMPYLRATMTNVLSNAGFGTVLFPLINVYELAKDSDCPMIDHTRQRDSQELEA